MLRSNAMGAQQQDHEEVQRQRDVRKEGLAEDVATYPNGKVQRQRDRAKVRGGEGQPWARAEVFEVCDGSK